MLFKPRQALIRTISRAFGHDAPHSQINYPPNVEPYKIIHKPYRGIHAYGDQPTRPPTEGGRILETTWVAKSSNGTRKLPEAEHKH